MQPTLELWPAFGSCSALPQESVGPWMLPYDHGTSAGCAATAQQKTVLPTKIPKLASELCIRKEATYLE